KVLRGAEPQVSGPYLDAELTVEEDRGQGAPAAEVQHAHAGPQIQHAGKPLGQPQRIGPAADAGNDPLGVIPRRAGKVLQDEPLIHVDALPLGLTRQMSRAPWWHDGPRHSARVGSIWMLGGRLSMGHSCDDHTPLSLTPKPEKAAHCRRDRQSGARRNPTRIPCWEQSARRFHDEDLPALPGSAR